MEDKGYTKHRQFVVRQEAPFNGGPPLALLVRSSVTPVDLFFVRNHGGVPRVDLPSYRLELNGAPGPSRWFTLEDLQSEFPRVTVAATLQCAGNRRQELIAHRPIPDELEWDAEAISHGVWSGARLRDVLLAAGFGRGDLSDLHVAFTGLDETERLGARVSFGGSIPLAKALSPEVLLAYEMNGAPLPPAHGFPLRLVAPGYIGARSVKWLKSITAQPAPSDNYFQAHAYKLFPPHVDKETVRWEKGLMLGETSVTSAICEPAPGARIPASPLPVRGYAMAGGTRQVARVELSADGGASWIEAKLLGSAQPWTWRLWEAEVEVPRGRHTLVVRAVDSAANSQPPGIDQVWNLKGYMNNAWHRVDVVCE